MYRLLHHFLLAGLLLSLWGVAEAAPPAGTVITNTANGTGQTGGGATGVNSNTVNANVLNGGTAIIAVTLSSPTSSSTPGATVALTASAGNSGGDDASAVPVSVNGAAASLFVAVDWLEPNYRLRRLFKPLIVVAAAAAIVNRLLF